MVGVRHVDDILAVEGVDGFSEGRAGLFRPKPILVVLEGDVIGCAVHPLELTTMLPLISPSPVIQRVANGVIRNADAIQCGQLVQPVVLAIGYAADGGCPVGISVGDDCCAHCSGGKRVRRLAQDIPAQIIGENPGGAAGSARGVVRIIGPDQLADGVVLVGERCQVVLVDADDIPPVVVGVDQVAALLSISLLSSLRCP